MLRIGEIFRDFLLPALIVAAGLAMGWWRGRNGRWIGAMVVSGGFALALCGISGAPRWPPGTGDAAFWLVWFTIPTAALGTLDALFQPPLWLRALILLALAPLGLRALLAPLAAHAAPDAVWTLESWIDGLSGVAALWWLALETEAERWPGVMTPVILTLVAAGVAVVLGASDNVKAAESAMALSAMAGAAAMVGWRRPSLSLGRGAVVAFTLPLLGLLVFVHFYSYTEPPLASAGLILIAPLLASAGDLPGLRRGGRWRAAARIAPVVLALGLAAILTIRHSRSDVPLNPGETRGYPWAESPAGLKPL